MLPWKEVFVMTDETDLKIMLLCLELESKRKRAKEIDVDATLEKIHWSLKHDLLKKKAEEEA